MSMTDKLNVIVLDAYKSLFLVHQEHRRVQCQLELRACANERTANRLSAAFTPSELESYQPWRRFHLFRLSQHTHTDFTGILFQNYSRAASRTLFSYENLGSTAQEFSRKCEMLRCENSMLAIILLNYGMSVHNLSALTH